MVQMQGDQQPRPQPEGLEDQLRRMILNSASTPTRPRYSELPLSQHAIVQTASSSRPPPQAPPQFHGNAAFPNGPSMDMSPHAVPTEHRPSMPEQGGYYKPQQSRPQGTPPHRQLFGDRPAPPNQHAHQQQQRARFQKHVPVGPNAFPRGRFEQLPQHRQADPQRLWNPDAPQQRQHAPTGISQQHLQQAQYLEQIATAEISHAEMSNTERDEKETFRQKLQEVCHEVCEADPARLPSVALECFGSFKSGFATADSDMDLVIVVKDQVQGSACFSLLKDDLPRVLEKRLLQLGYGARLLTKTRVPIIKVCEKPDAILLESLREERRKWDYLAPEQKYSHLFPEAAAEGHQVAPLGEVDVGNVESGEGIDAASESLVSTATDPANALINEPSPTGNLSPAPVAQPEAHRLPEVAGEALNGPTPPQKRDQNKRWTRERKGGPLDFPKTGVGIQSDINFFNPLGLHNTQLLRCYSLCDPRVRPMVLFVKAWAKRRKINSSYSGTLSSYGYVLMVLHYLVNVVQPPVLPNLQASWRPPGVRPADTGDAFLVEEWPVLFWHNDEEIYAAAQKGLLTWNRESLGSLLAGFFHYYSSQGGGPTFHWMQQVLSLRSPGGLLTKETKGWTKAVTEEGEGKRVQHRFLFCIEDPFELTHNVARTVTHNGIVAIRDEFRRAKRVLLAVGYGQSPMDGELLADLLEDEDSPTMATGNRQIGGPSAAVEAGLVHDEHFKTPGVQENGPSHPPAPASRPRGGPRDNATGRDRPRPTMPAPEKEKKQRQRFDVHDNEAFPTLGKGAKGPKKKRGALDQGTNEEYSEISGDKARIVLEEARRKKEEAQAESTARYAAQAVLGDSD